MRVITFDTERPGDRERFQLVYLVFVTSTGVPQNLEELGIALALKQKLMAISGEGDTPTLRNLKPGTWPIRLEETEWAYLLAALTPPKGRWSNMGADIAMEILTMLKQAPRED